MATANPTPAPPTLREIAQRAGVSHTTVSLALRNDPVIPESTRARVHQMADTMGYRSNVLVSALMTQVRLRHQRAAAEVVGFLTAGPSAEDWKHHSSSVGFFEGARRRAQQLGLRVETFWLGHGGENAGQVGRLLSARAIRGNLLAPFPVPVYEHELEWKRLICVALGYAFKQHPLHRATHHHFRGSFTAFANLQRLGYQRIGLMLDPGRNSRVDYSWLGGYFAAQRMLGGAVVSPLISAEDGPISAVRRWLDHERPEAVIGFGPRQLSTLEAAGRSVPGDLAFAALDVQQAKLDAVNRVSGIDQNLPAIGATAIEILAGQLYHNEHGLPRSPVLSMIEGFWVDGYTAPGRLARRKGVRALAVKSG